MNSTTTISDLLDKTTLSYLMLKTRMTLGPNDLLVPAMLQTTHELLSIIVEETNPIYFTDEEAEQVGEMSNFLLDMADDEEWEHLFTEEIE